MTVEKYIAAASLGFFVMFVAEILTLYYFLSQSPDLEIYFEPAPKILQYISIGIAPAAILAGTSFLMSRQYGSKPIGYIIIGGGVILLVGMVYAYIILDKIPEIYLIQAVIIVPPLFMAISVPVIVVGLLLLKSKKRRPKKEYV